MELREIEIFLTLAEELHFSRTAERLHISQARVSQAIKRQERLIGASLFERTSRSVRLTPIGQRLAEGLRQGYDVIQGSLTEASAAARGLTGELSIGVMGALGHELLPVIKKFLAEYPDCEVHVQEVHFSDPFGPLREGAVDLLLVWLPVHEPDLAVGPVLLTEGRVLAVRTGDELAERTQVTMEDLADRTVLDPGPALPSTWIEAMLPSRTPAGRPIPRGPRASTFHEVLSHVAAGVMVCPLNAHVQRFYTPPGVTFVPLADVPVTEWALLWRKSRNNSRLRAFAHTAQTLGPRPL